MKINVKLGNKYIATCNVDENFLCQFKKQNCDKLYVVKACLDSILNDVMVNSRRHMPSDSKKLEGIFEEIIYNFKNIKFEGDNPGICLNV